MGQGAGSRGKSPYMNVLALKIWMVPELVEGQIISLYQTQSCERALRLKINIFTLSINKFSCSLTLVAG